MEQIASNFRSVKSMKHDIAVHLNMLHDIEVVLSSNCNISLSPLKDITNQLWLNSIDAQKIPALSNFSRIDWVDE